MRTRRIFLLSLLVLTVLAVIDGYAGSPSASWGWRDFARMGSQQVVGGSAHASVSGRASASLPEGGVVTIANPRGSIRVTGEDRQDVAIDYTITVFAEKEEQAAAYVGPLRVEAAREGDGISLDVIEPGARPQGVAGISVDYEIRMPRRGRVDLSNAFGSVDVQGVAGPSRVDNQYKETDIRRVEGDWDVHGRFAPVRVAGVGGSLKIDGGYGAAQVSQVAGPVTGGFEFGAVEVEGAAALDLKSSYGAVQADRIRGPLRLELSFSGAEIGRLTHDLQVSGRYGDVSVDLDPAAPGFRIDAETRGGQLWNRIGALQGRAVSRSGDRSRFEAVLGDGSRQLRISLRNGSITLRQ
ncbi:DUF4097 family beta strand repeat-containing protein [Limnochorda pilosa]|uniref:Adhesin domain-containing protein n=1 Tax=Limnochorda pilosa TaxID=1555112 RepID=A0A0K2SG83_LIMPI|nr:hypothetical protein [Limnochorda pilosa]BAS26111.1 hypothetical protein LIP_0254 [Limnochorda pilosa]